VVERVRDILSLESERSGSVEFPGLKESIEFKKVSVSVNGRDILSDINLSLWKGERLGIVGHTGSGKSTLVRMRPFSSTPL